MQSVDHAAAAINAFEASTGYTNFKNFTVEQARRFRKQLLSATNPKTGASLSLATIHSRLAAVKAFVQWLCEQPGYKSRISRTDGDYFSIAANDERVAKATREKPVPSLEQIRHAIFAMPTETMFQRRGRAVVAALILTGARDDALASLLVGDVDVIRRSVSQDARHVRTKRRKTFVSAFFPIGDDIEQVVTDWIVELTQVHLFGPTDPLFPPTEIGVGADQRFGPVGFKRTVWASADAIRTIVRGAFDAVGLPYFNPHSFRSTLALLGERRCTTPEELKAWSQNLGHEDVLTTFSSYGTVSAHRQAEIFDKMRTRTDNPETDPAVLEALEGLLKRYRNG